LGENTEAEIFGLVFRWLLAWHGCLNDQALNGGSIKTSFVAVNLEKARPKDSHTVFIILDN
jgi:hypothetical protein